MTHSHRSALLSLSLTVSFAAFGCQPGAPKESSSPNSPRKSAEAPEAISEKVPAVPINREFNDAARFIAGMQPEPGSTFTDQSARPEWSRYAASFDKNWAKLDSTRIAPMRKWASAELHEGNSSTVFYPFSGPDFLHATTFFPNASSYVLVALEPTGAAPDFHQMSPDAMDQFFSTVDRALDSLLSFSFFKTDNMKVDVRRDLEGTLPILMLFLARTGNSVDDVKKVEIDGEGNVVAAGTAKLAAGARSAKGVDITFRAADGRQKHLSYFSVNLHDDYMKKSVFKAYMARLAGVNTYLKSASYLLHKNYFSTIRQAILDHSALLVQDDSGVPYRLIKPDKWEVSLYGVYSGPIAMFKDHKETDLIDAYKEANRAKALPFGIGYIWRAGKSNLLVAHRKTGT
jgi:hypothetical protein